MTELESAHLIYTVIHYYLLVMGWGAAQVVLCHLPVECWRKVEENGRMNGFHCL